METINEGMKIEYQKAEMNAMKISASIFYGLQVEIDKIEDSMLRISKMHEISYGDLGLDNKHYTDINKSLHQALVSLEIARKQQLEFKNRLEIKLLD